MKKISRLTALLLALLMLSPAALATEDAIPQGDLTIDNYALMVAAAQSTSEAVGKIAVTNQDNVEVNSKHYTTGWMGSKVIDTLEKGAMVTITSVNGGLLDGYFSQWYGVYYEKDGETRTGYVQTKYLDVQEPVPEITYEPWNGEVTSVQLAYEVAGAAEYVWERGVIDENGDVTWQTEPVATGAILTLETDLSGDYSALKYTYRCVAKSESGETLEMSERVTLIREDIVVWLASGEITSEMLTRAMNAPSIESVVIEGEWLIYVRTGEEIAYYDARTNALISSETGKLLGFVIGDAVYAPRD